MRMRRIMSALTLAFAAGLSAACGDDGSETAKSAAPATSGAAATSAAASPSVDVKADTERICNAVAVAFQSEKMQLLKVLITLASEDDKATRDAAVADATAIIGRLKAVVDKETATAADPKVKVALQGLIATLTNMLTAEALADPDYEKKMDTAMDAAAAYCPILKE